MASKQIRRGEVYWVNLEPTVGSEIRKQRPAIIVSNNNGNLNSPVVTIVPTSSKLSKLYPFEVFLPAGAGGLQKDSIVQTNQIRTVDKQRLIGAPLGRIDDQKLIDKINNAMRIHLSLHELSKYSDILKSAKNA